ncbi:MAG: PD40 domain-containing protein, partial [Bacteroidales bacterium]|nr:PD40 domain-containing protein [Bacteroidales bacterium]
MKRILISIAAIITAASAMAQETPQWIRRNAISPDGKTIAFGYKGDIYTVPSEGGLALQITTNKAYESDPIWTPDGGRIVFSSWREGSKDIFITGKDGGIPTRLTTMPGNETPLAVSPDGYVYYNWYTTALQSPGYDGFPGDPALYRSSLEGGAPELVTSLTICGMSIGPGGAILYEDWKGYEDPLRKHHTSSVTRDIWKWEMPGQAGHDGKFTRLTTYNGEDRNPVWGPGGDTFYYLSEEGGSNINVWKSSVSNLSAKTRLTSYDKNPARFLSVANDGTLCYSYNGDLYLLKEGGEPRKVEITVNRDEADKAVNQMQMKNASAMAVSPDGKEIALVMRGDVFVTSTEFATTRRITNTPEQERGVSFSKDGRELYYASERNGCWSIYKSSLTNKEDKYFTYSASFKEERVSPEGETSFQVQVSPDGKHIAYLRDRTELVVMPASGGKPKSLFKDINYSYTDGDQEFAWSPDSRYILTTWMADGGWNNVDIAVVEVESGKITNLTESGYSDDSFRWALGGKAMTFESDKNGYRSHGSWGAEDDIYIMFFDGKAFADFGRSKEQKEIDKMLLGEKKAEKEEKKAEKDSLAKKVEKVKLDLENRDVRIKRLTRFSNRMGDHYLTQDGAKLYFTQRLEKGYDLCMLDIEKGDITVVKKGVMGSFTPSPDGKSIFIFRGAQLSKLDISNNKDKAISFSGDYEYKPQEEREYIFEHCWKQVKEKFYVPDLHGADWDYYHTNYASKL